ncbi:Argininosuccinate lyase [Candidatus Portiera aleyrodidarum]|uniref:argininosuccinate lyase n=1 Tax=Candidatus Portiera aleyrodidarum TaxID=91844 RepID=A0A6S6RST1_9GAMM|nr:argininosuccinate lyase [Candidatus Portiera aleyrodidarum]CAA3704429.1 Argininosuccinate lyase [Candidatus Portiera aleyrodidarum]
MKNFNNLKKPWSGQLKKSTDTKTKLVKNFSISRDLDLNFDFDFDFDFRLRLCLCLYLHDIKVSIAYTKMLEIVGILNFKESKLMIKGLKKIEKDKNNKKINWFINFEDIHLNIETNLINKIGNIGKKLYNSRSRNNQISIAIRLYLRYKIDKIKLKITKLRKILINLAISESDTIMPGFTNVQIAQPITTFGHHILAWHDMILRDHLRILECRKRINVLPLALKKKVGQKIKIVEAEAAVFIGTTYSINHEIIKDLLGFDHITDNSLDADAISDRDFAIEFTSFSSILLMHLSRMCEKLMLWTSLHFDFIELPDYLCTGLVSGLPKVLGLVKVSGSGSGSGSCSCSYSSTSSIMPQKKIFNNIPEYIKVKTGRIFGNLLNLLMSMKSQPLLALAYNKDNKDEDYNDKEPLFDTAKTVINCIEYFLKSLKSLIIKPQKMYLSALCNYSTATEFADYLVKRGVPLRDAHSIVGHEVYYYGLKNKNKNNFFSKYIEKLRQFSSKIKIDEEILEVFTLEGSVNARNHIGDTSPNQVRSAALRAKKYLKRLIG